jgi:FKBP-type peptidyl-prolyl cis-trans isomerase
MNKSSNVTGTAIAVALAVVIAAVLLYFGQKYLNQSSTASVATTTPVTMGTTTQQETSSTTNQTSMNDETQTSAVPADPTQLLMKDEVVGTGAEAKVGDTVTVNYVGMLTNGTVFDASTNHGSTGFTFPLGAGQVIKGWDEGVVGMKVGGKRELVIPASLGYGNQAVGSIPANSTLVFQIELLNVQAGS